MYIPKLIACDLDGTLLNENHLVSKRAFDLISKLTQKGIFFFAASGRQYNNLRFLFDPIKDDIGYICENGCLCFIKQKLVYHREMERSLAEKIIADIRAHSDCHVLVSVLDHQYIFPNEDFYRFLKETIHINTQIISSVDEIKEPILKVAVFRFEGYKDTYWKKKYKSCCTVQTSGHTWVDLLPLHVNKGATLKHVLPLLNLSAKDCMAFGDHENDKEMLELVGYPITMKNGIPSILPLGKETTDSVEDILQRILDQLEERS